MSWEVYALNRLGYLDVIGIDIDISEQQIKIVKARGLNCICVDFLIFLKSNGKTFDVIMCFELIEYLELEKAYEFGKLCHNNFTSRGFVILLKNHLYCTIYIINNIRPPKVIPSAQLILAYKGGKDE